METVSDKVAIQIGLLTIKIAEQEVEIEKKDAEIKQLANTIVQLEQMIPKDKATFPTAEEVPTNGNGEESSST